MVNRKRPQQHSTALLRRDASNWRKPNAGGCKKLNWGVAARQQRRVIAELNARQLLLIRARSEGMRRDAAERVRMTWSGGLPPPAASCRGADERHNISKCLRGWAIRAAERDLLQESGRGSGCQQLRAAHVNQTRAIEHRSRLEDVHQCKLSVICCKNWSWSGCRKASAAFAERKMNATKLNKKM
jgi:hypothetical protein